MDQTDDGQALVKTLIQLIEAKRLEVKVYTKGRLHAKAYIFDYKDGAIRKTASPWSVRPTSLSRD